MHYDGTNLLWANRRLHTANVVFGEVMYNPGGVCGPRVQNDFELVVLHSGQCRVTVNGAARDLQIGAASLFLPDGKEYFRFSEDKQTHHSYCSIRPAFMPDGMRPRLRRAPISVACSGVFHHLIAGAFELHTPRDGAAAMLLEQLGICLFAEFLNASFQLRDTANRDHSVRAFLQHVEDHFGEANCLQDAHDAAGISRNALIYKFRNEMHTTPGRHLWRIRVERGAAMLNETGLTAAEIAFRCGFKNPFHFSRMIRKCFGQSPTDLRRKAWYTKA